MVRPAPLPAGFYGNAFAFAVAACAAGRLREMPLGDVVGMVADAKARAVDTVRALGEDVPGVGRDAGRVRGRRDFGWGEGEYGGPAAAPLATFHLKVKAPGGEEVIAVLMCLPSAAIYGKARVGPGDVAESLNVYL
uniref:Uncharacterized protein n=1 Tax=Leersia perrieri TaxID=77586 RepID=A0A0D9X055_9ORYZ